MTGRCAFAAMVRMALAALLLAACHSAPPDSGYTGTWILEAGERPFMVLTLRVDGARVTGSFTGPEAWTTSDGVRFSGVHGISSPRPIAKGSQGTAGLRLAVEDPKDKANPDEIDLAILDADHLSLSLVGTPFAPWTLMRYRGARPPAIPDDWDPARTYAVRLPPTPTNAEMTALFDADQKDRHEGQAAFEERRTEIASRDAARRGRARDLLDAGQLHAGEDYRRAAFLFQHGTTPADYLFAHTLALVALTKGDAEAGWIAAASLDRYLRSIGKPVIFGTGFVEKDGSLMAEEPFDRTVITEALRRELGVRPVAEWADDYTAFMKSTAARPSSVSK